jgi:putative DNA primase/helicase
MPTETTFTEDALAAEFTRRFTHHLRYVHEWGQWLAWDGHRWKPERTLAVFDCARALVRELGAKVESSRERAKLESAATVAAIVTLARADRVHARLGADFDRDPWLLNTRSGTVSLRTGTIRPWLRDDGITKLTPVAPADTTPERWLECLQTWTDGDDDLIAFLQRLCGYWLTGTTREETLVIIYGPGANGKTKFVETVRGCLGHDYATGIALETLLVTHGEQHPTDLADLRGKRLAIAMETEEGRRLAEAKIKMLTGGDRIRARHMRRDFFEFDPTHKLVIVGNHKPGLRNVDEAMRRRLVLVPFDHVIPTEQRDPQLAAKLATELPAVLGWMLAGCRAWLERGLDPPARVQAATTDYLASADQVGRWMEECCVIGPTAYMTKGAAFESYKAWAGAAGERVESKRWLGERLRSTKGVDETKNDAHRWLGIGLRT